MPGLDKDRVFDSSKIDDEILCSICLAIFIDPLVTPCCRQTYCGECIKDWLRTNSSCPNDRKQLIAEDLVESPRFIINWLNKLEFKCIYAINGCEERLTFETQSKHNELCRFGHKPNDCCNVCGETFGEIASHNCVENLCRINQELTKKLENYDKEANVMIDGFNAMSKQYAEEMEQKNQIIETNTALIKELNDCITKLSGNFYSFLGSVKSVDETYKEKVTQLTREHYNYITKKMSSTSSTTNNSFANYFQNYMKTLSNPSDSIGNSSKNTSNSMHSSQGQNSKKYNFDFPPL